MSEAAARPGFTKERLGRLMEMERSHFWFAGRRDLIDGLLGRYLPGPARLADVGVGGGFYCQSLAARGYRMTAVDFLPAGLQRLAAEAPGVRTVLGSAERLGLRDGSFDGALALDMLEHVDDQAAMGELFRILRPGGRLVLTVPALPWLWSYRDVAAGHKRRYMRETLRALLDDAGFTVEEMGFYNFLLLPVAAASRVAGRLGPASRDLEDMPPRPVNALFRSINRWEVRCGQAWRWPSGSSLFAVAAKTR